MMRGSHTFKCSISACRAVFAWYIVSVLFWSFVTWDITALNFSTWSTVGRLIWCVIAVIAGLSAAACKLELLEKGIGKDNED